MLKNDNDFLIERLNKCNMIEYKQKAIEFIEHIMYDEYKLKRKYRKDIEDFENNYEDGLFVVAIKDGKVIGTIALEKNREYYLIRRFYVLDIYRGYGVGSKLWDTMINYVNSNLNVNKLYLVTNIIHKKAHILYRHKGCVQIKKNEIPFETEVLEDNLVFSILVN